MAEVRDELCLVDEVLRELRIVAEVISGELQRDIAVEAAMSLGARQVHRRHTAAGDLDDNVVPPDLLGHRRHESHVIMVHEAANRGPNPWETSRVAGFPQEIIT
jgi:hypothetical protein